MRTIRRHIIHASATPNDRDVTAKDIDLWHKQRGWSGIGYHNVIRRDGTLEMGRPIAKAGAHVAGHNADSIGTCLIGAGLALSDFTPEQLATLKRVYDDLSTHFPGITLHGHREYSNKSCPGFDIPELLACWQRADAEWVRSSVMGAIHAPAPLPRKRKWWHNLFNMKG